MCQIIVNTPKYIFEETELKNSGKNNPDGFGIAYTDGKKLKVYKTMKLNTFINKYKEVRTQFPKSYILLHTRLATHGKKCVDNSHPFKVTKDICMAHNGVFSGFGSTDLSDTLDFINTILKPIDRANPNELNELLFNPSKNWFHTILSKAIGRSNKIAFLNSKNQIAIINATEGHFDKIGNWFSNYSHTYCASSHYNYYREDDDRFFDYDTYNRTFSRCKCGNKLVGYEKYLGECDNCFQSHSKQEKKLLLENTEFPKGNEVNPELFMD